MNPAMAKKGTKGRSAFQKVVNLSSLRNGGHDKLLKGVTKKGY